MHETHPIPTVHDADYKTNAKHEYTFLFHWPLCIYCWLRNHDSSHIIIVYEFTHGLMHEFLWVRDWFRWKFYIEREGIINRLMDIIQNLKLALFPGHFQLVLAVRSREDLVHKHQWAWCDQKAAKISQPNGDSLHLAWALFFLSTHIRLWHSLIVNRKASSEVHWLCTYLSLVQPHLQILQSFVCIRSINLATWWKWFCKRTAFLN